MNIEYTLVRELKPYANNARTHSRKQVRQIANSIKRFGFNNPVLIDDKNQIVAGHGRVEAAKLLSLHAVPTVRLSHLSDTDKRAYILADNKLAAKAGWDREILAIELQGLIDLGVDVEVTGFEAAEVDVILDDAREANDNTAKPEDETPEVPATAVTCPGDLWVLGQHRLVCGDCREAGVYQALLEGGSAEFVFTDPPYKTTPLMRSCFEPRVPRPGITLGDIFLDRAGGTHGIDILFPYSQRGKSPRRRRRSAPYFPIQNDKGNLLHQ